MAIDDRVSPHPNVKDNSYSLGMGYLLVGYKFNRARI